MNKPKTALSRRKFLRDSAKVLAAATAVKWKVPLLLLGGNGVIMTNTGCRKTEVANDSLNIDSPDAENIRSTFEELTVDVPPEELYRLFNQFCLTHFGAETDPVVYERFGKELEITADSRWRHISERSAVVAWSTNLPARTCIEYGADTSYGRKTESSERYYYTHLHYLGELDPDRQYHYRMIAIDERGNRMETDDQVFHTRRIPGAIRIPDDLGKPPFILDQPNAYYLVTKDIHAEKTAFQVEAEQITIDLGGHTVTHGNELIDDPDYEILSRSGAGIRRRGDSASRGLTILNGILKQGKAENNREYFAAEDMLRREPRERYEKLRKNMSRGFSNIEIADVEDVEIAGITAEHRWHQVWGMRIERASGTYNIHHNVFLDKGTQMFSRHGDGTVRSLGFRDSASDENCPEHDMRIHHNLVKRTRQNALQGAQSIAGNEIYVDSWVVNSFAISPFNRKGEVLNNKIFMTGYYGCGITWASEELNVSGNFIHMENINTMIDPPEQGRRLIETWGEQDVQIGMRLTNYGTGGQERQDFLYDNNVIFGRSRGNAIMRGIALYSDHSVENVVVQQNKIRILATDEIIRKAACVVAQGANNDRSQHLPLYYRECVLESNICNVRFGDEYGRGSNHRFINCKIVKTGEHPDYHTFVFDGGDSVFNHVFLDCEFLGGAAYDDVYWHRTQSGSNYRIDWTLTIKTDPGAGIVIRDRNGNRVFDGTCGPRGETEIVLTQSIIRPLEWKPDGEEVDVEEKSGYQEEIRSPYTIVVQKEDGQTIKTVDLTQRRTLKV